MVLEIKINTVEFNSVIYCSFMHLIRRVTNTTYKLKTDILFVLSRRIKRRG